MVPPGRLLTPTSQYAKENLVQGIEHGIGRKQYKHNRFNNNSITELNDAFFYLVWLRLTANAPN